MKKYIYSFLLLVLSALLMTSCLIINEIDHCDDPTLWDYENQNDYFVYDNCYVKSDHIYTSETYYCSYGYIYKISTTSYYDKDNLKILNLTTINYNMQVSKCNLCGICTNNGCICYE